MQFYSPENFIYLLLIPGVLIIFSWAAVVWRQKIKSIGSQELLEAKLMPSHDKSLQTKRLLCLILAVLFATLALTRPQWGEEKKKIERKGIDVIFLLDTSLSMLAEDIKPSRLEKSKLEIRNFLHQLKGDRVGMVAFAGSSFLQSPLTLDYSAFQLFVDAVSPGYIPDPGTSLASALRLALKAFPAENTKHKAVVVFSDGEDHEGGIEEVLKEAVKANVRIYALGTGSEKGDPIPLKNEAGQRSGFKKDRAGQIVITKLNPAAMQQIAQETHALYAPATPGEQEVSVLIRHMDSIDKRQIQEKTVAEREDHYQFFLLLAFIFLFLEMTLRQTRKLGRKSAVVLNSFLALSLFFLHSGFLDTSRSLNNKGSSQYQDKKYQSAAENYRQAEVKNPKDPVIRYNLGTTLYQTKDFVQATRELEESIANTKDPGILAPALYNYGNAQYRLGNFEKAIDSYKKALELNPKDQDAKYNLEFLENKKNALDKKDQEKKKQDPKKDPQQNKNQNQQQNQQQQQNQDQNQKQQDQNQQKQNQQNQSQSEGSQDQQQQSGNDQQDKSQGSQEKQDSEKKPDQGEDQSKNEEQKTEDKQQGQKQSEEQGDQDQGKQGSESEDKKDQKPDNQNSDEQKQDQPQNEDQKSEDQKPQDSGSEETKGAENQTPSPGSQPLQGQMSINEALKILEAMKDSEKDLQDLRKPPVKNRPKYVEKDW